MKKYLVRIIGAVVWCILIIVVGVGCDETVEPFSEAGAYSVYGNLSFQDEAHFFRIRPLKQPLDSSAESLDATVTLTNLSNGKTRTLRDSVITFEGIRTHNYWTTFKVEPTTTYELKVEDPEKQTTTVRTTTPTDADPVVVPAQGAECGDGMEVRFREAESPVEVYVGFRYEEKKHWVRRANVESVSGREDKVLRFSLSGVLGSVIPTGLREPPPCTQLDDPTLQIAVLYSDPERNVEEASLQVTIDPTQQERVENGVGFFGAYRRDTITAEVDTTMNMPVP